MTLKAEKNTLKIWVNIDEDAPEDEVKQYQGEDGTDTLKNMGSYFLTSIKPQTRALSANVKVKVKQGDETINYVEMSYKEAKKYLEDAQKEAEEEADADAGEAEGDADAGADAEAEADADAAETEGE